MPLFEFTLVIEGVDLLSDESLDAIDEYNAGFLDDPPLDGVTFVNDRGTRKAIFTLVAADQEAAVAFAADALTAALPDAQVVSVLAGRHPGELDIR